MLAVNLSCPLNSSHPRSTASTRWPYEIVCLSMRYIYVTVQDRNYTAFFYQNVFLKFIRCNFAAVTHYVDLNVFLTCRQPHSMRRRSYVTVGSPCVRPSVCPVDRQQQHVRVSLLLSSRAGSRYRSIAAGAAYYRSMSAARARAQQQTNRTHVIDG